MRRYAVSEVKERSLVRWRALQRLQVRTRCCSAASTVCVCERAKNAICISAPTMLSGRCCLFPSKSIERVSSCKFIHHLVGYARDGISDRCPGACFFSANSANSGPYGRSEQKSVGYLDRGRLRRYADIRCLRSTMMPSTSCRTNASVKLPPKTQAAWKWSDTGRLCRYVVDIEWSCSSKRFIFGCRTCSRCTASQATHHRA